MSRQQISWWLWAAGSVIIALSWFKVVSNSVGWGGFVLGMVGSVIGWGVRPPQGTPPPTIPKQRDNDAWPPPPNNPQD